MKLALKASYVCIGIILLTTDIFALKHVIIQGEAAFAKGAEIRFYLYDELLTRNKTLITKTYINEEGAFQVEIPVLETRELILNINTSEGSIFVEPEKNYNIILHTNEQLINRIDAKYLGNTIQISILNSDTNELNWKINFFNQYYNYFLYKHSVPIISMIPQNVYDSLLQIITDRFPLHIDTLDFYSIYTTFRIAQIEKMYYKKSMQKLYDKYLNNKYIHYHNPAYMDFFIQCYDNYIYAGSKYITRKLLLYDINQLNDYYTLSNDLGKDPYLLNEMVREIALIKNLSTLFLQHEDFNKKNLLLLLRKIAETTKFEEHKKMAENTIFNLTNLKAGSIAPDCQFKDIHNNTLKLSDYKGKYVFLHFFTLDCQECIREMLIIKKLYEMYGDYVEFFSVMLDVEPSKLYHFVSAYPEFKWNFVHFNKDFTFIDAYKIYSLPLGMFLNEKSYIISYPTPIATELGSLFLFTFKDVIHSPYRTKN
jgi:thiol-disulfide isomerase/thioredoxin